MTARQRSWVDSMSLNVIASAAARDPAPRVTFVRSRTVEKVDSIGLVVRRWTQCWACGTLLVDVTFGNPLQDEEQWSMTES